MWPDTEGTRKLGIRYPIIQAGMAGGITTPELVAAVSNAGGLGTLGAGYLSPEETRYAIGEIRSLTTKPFAVNVFIPQTVTEQREQIEEMDRYLDRYRQQFRLRSKPANLFSLTEAFLEQIEVVLEEGVPVLSFTFGLLPADILRKLKQAGIILMGTATTVQEAMVLRNQGLIYWWLKGVKPVDIGEPSWDLIKEGLVGTLALVPQMVNQVEVPVLAAGGIMDERGIAAGLMLGATGVQMGTAFLTCMESGAHQTYKEALLQGKKGEATVLTQAFSGKAARGIKNAFIEEMEDYQGVIPAYPIQNKLTHEVRGAAARQGRAEYMSLWAGQAFGLCQVQSVNGFMKRLVQDTTQLFTR